LDQFFDWQEIWTDITRRNYITIGMAGFILLAILAATSTNRMVKKLGGKRWALLHRLVYPASILACLHFYMMRKGVQIEPILYSATCAVFLGYRIIIAWNKKAQ
jgi:sulfoxide reductase heme-binding subunit YedZ